MNAVTDDIITNGQQTASDEARAKPRAGRTKATPKLTSFVQWKKLRATASTLDALAECALSCHATEGCSVDRDGISMLAKIIPTNINYFDKPRKDFGFKVLSSHGASDVLDIANILEAMAKHCADGVDGSSVAFLAEHLSSALDQIEADCEPTPQRRADADLIRNCERMMTLEAEYCALAVGQDEDMPDTPAEYYDLIKIVTDTPALTDAGNRAKLAAVIAFYDDDYPHNSIVDGILWGAVKGLARPVAWTVPEAVG
jgi:hypothetical protein